MSCVLKATLKPTLSFEKSDQAAPGSLQGSFYFWAASSVSYQSLATTFLSHRVLSLSIIILCPFLKEFYAPQIPIPCEQPCLTDSFKGWITWSSTNGGLQTQEKIQKPEFLQILLTPSQRCFMPSSSACIGFSEQEAFPTFYPLRPIVLWKTFIWRCDLVAINKWKSSNLGSYIWISTWQGVKLVWLIFVVNFTGDIITFKTQLWVCLWGCFWEV